MTEKTWGSQPGARAELPDRNGAPGSPIIGKIYPDIPAYPGGGPAACALSSALKYKPGDRARVSNDAVSQPYFRPWETSISLYHCKGNSKYITSDRHAAVADASKGSGEIERVSLSKFRYCAY